MDFNKITNAFANRKPEVLGNREKRKYAILLPIVEKDDELHLLFQVRSGKLRSQPNDVCFPGGRVEEIDETFEDAAIRETVEELGIQPKNITDVYPLDYMTGDVYIYPFVAKIHHPEQIKINPDEVAEIFTVPLSFLLNNDPIIHYVDLQPIPREDFPYHLIPGGKNYTWRARKLIEPFIEYEGKIIWGWTAYVLGHFIEELKRANKLF